MVFGVGDLPLRRWSSDGASSRGGRLVRARGSSDLPCAVFPLRLPWCGGAGIVKVFKVEVMMFREMEAPVAVQGADASRTCSAFADFEVGAAAMFCVT